VKQRLFSALIALSIVVPLLVFGGKIGMYILAYFIVILGTDEWLRMTLPNSRQVWVPFQIITTAGLTICLLSTHDYLGIVGASILSMVVALYGTTSNAEAKKALFSFIFGLIYLVGLVPLMCELRLQENGLAWLFFMFFITWSGDTGAYFAGRSFGKRKLFERVSPNKTIEGAIGGAVLSILVSILYAYYFLPELPLYHAAILGLVLDFFGVSGDLFESLLKREAKVKDSGWILPGHGGVLDRMDSMLIIAPVLWLYIQYVL
jgi:phosphatidate cytidylyltransferase